MLEAEAHAKDCELEEATDYFFKLVGQVRFTQSESAVSEGERNNGWVRAIDSAPLHGIVAFADNSGKSQSPCLFL